MYFQDKKRKMKKSLIGIVIMLGVGFTACTNQGSSNEQTQIVNEIENKTTGNMKNLISIVEIPTTDFSRAVAFYQEILNVSVEETDMDGTKCNQ